MECGLGAYSAILYCLTIYDAKRRLGETGNGTGYSVVADGLRRVGDEAG